MSLLKRSGILSLLAASTIGLTAMADTQTERPNRPAKNPYLDCPEDVVDVWGEGEGDVIVFFDDGTAIRMVLGDDYMELLYSNAAHGAYAHEYEGQYPCPEEAWQEYEERVQRWHARKSLEDPDKREETVKSAIGQQVLETPAGQAWYDSLHTWMQQQVDQWTNEWKAENSTQSSGEMENTGQSAEPDPFDAAYQREMNWYGLIMEYSSGDHYDGDFKDVGFSEEADEDPAFGLPSF